MANIEILDNIEAVIEDVPVINVSMANPIYRGPQGVQGEKGAQGEKGDTGNSGVYVGSAAPVDENIVVWIDMTGDAELEPAEEVGF